MRIGVWFCTPSRAVGLPATLHGHGDGQRVELRYSGEILPDFLAKFGHLETCYASSASAPSGAESSFPSGQYSHA
jgi:hypothetical protein